MKDKRNDLEKFDKDELEDIERTLFVTIIPTQNCDFRCWYCDVVDFEQRHRFMEDKEFSAVVEWIKTQGYKNLVIRFYGGEPFIHPRLSFFINMLEVVFSDYNLDILVTTNFNKSLDFYEKFGTKMVIAPSLHTDFVTDTDGWMEKCVKFKKRIHHISLMLQEGNQEQILDIYNKYRRLLPVMVVPIDQYLGTDSYKKFKEDNSDVFIDDSEYVIFYGDQTKFHHIMCSSGFIIDEDCNLYYCWPRYGEPILNVFYQNKQVKKWHMCDRFCDECDQEVVRSTIEHYTKYLRTKEFPDCPNRKVLFRCNG